MVVSLTEQETELDQLRQSKEVLTAEFEENPVVRYIPMITNKGKLKGELAHLTIRQFERFTGRPPRPSIIVNGKVPWHLAIDTIATESGYKSDEAFREAVLRAKDDKEELDSINRRLRNIKSDIKQTKRTPLSIEHIKLQGAPPVYPKDGESQEIVTEVNGLELKRRRNPSFWQVESDTTPGDGKPDVILRVRYSNQAGKLVNEAAKEHQEEFIKKHRISGRKQIRITPKRPKLKR